MVTVIALQVLNKKETSSGNFLVKAIWSITWSFLFQQPLTIKFHGKEKFHIYGMSALSFKHLLMSLYAINTALHFKKQDNLITATTNQLALLITRSL